MYRFRHNVLVAARASVVTGAEVDLYLALGQAPSYVYGRIRSAASRQENEDPDLSSFKASKLHSKVQLGIHY